MSDVLLRLVNMALVAIEFFVLLSLSTGFFPFKRRKSHVVLICVAAFLLQYAILVFLQGSTLLKLVAICIWQTLILLFIHRVHPLRCFAIALLAISLLNVGDYIMLFLISTISGMDMMALMATPPSYYLLAFFSKIAELFVASLIHGWARSRFHKRVASPGNYMKIAVFPALVLAISTTLYGAFLAYPDAAPHLFWCVVMLLVADIVAIVLLNQFEAQHEEVLASRVVHQQLKLAHDHITDLSTSYFHERKLTHDFRNKLAVIQGLLQQGQVGAEALAYINEVMEQEYMPALSVTTNRTVVDVLLNQKFRVAQQQQIDFRVQLDDLSEFPLPDDALVVVLSNLLDNALEACGKIPEVEKRSVLVKAQMTPSEGILVIKNSVAAPVWIQNGHIVSTKQNSRRHGFGLQNVIAIINTHEGSYAMDCTDVEFSFVLQIPRT